MKTGFRNSKKDLIFYTDGDGQYDVKEMKRLLTRIDKSDIVNGYKIKRADRLYRVVLGGMYNLAAKILFNIKMKEIDCDFRLMRRKIFDKIELESDSGVICVEMMKKIQSAGFKISDVPVHHYPRVSGSSQFFKLTRLVPVFIGLMRQWLKLVVFAGFGKE